MESYYNDQGPLSHFLEGEGQHDRSHSPPLPDHSPPLEQLPSFAPLASTKLRNRLRDASIPRLLLPLPQVLHIPEDPQSLWHRITARFGYKEDAHFLERFRYTIIASQLLHENPDLPRSGAYNDADGLEAATDGLSASVPLAPSGIIAAIVLPFLLARLLQWMITSNVGILRELGILLGFCGLAIVAHLLLRRQNARHTQDQALAGAQSLVSTLQGYEALSFSAFALVQEVELVAKGFRFSSPLPPISRLDESKTLRRCMPLRRAHVRTLKQLLKAYTEAHRALEGFRTLEDFEKFVDVYDLPREGIVEAMTEELPDDNDAASLATLRLVGYRTSCLRRAVMCDLLALKAGNDSISRSRWRAVTNIMKDLARAVDHERLSLRRELQEVEHFALPPSPSQGGKHSNERLRMQLRKIANVSTGIRSLQAKMTLLREESNAALAQADDLTDLGPSLMSQYEAIGTDIQALVRDWEHGKTALSSNISKHERRISLASSNTAFSPTSTAFSGMTIVTEGGPADALRTLNGEGQSELSFSPRSSMPSTPSDEEVFEAVALPKPRSTLTREERVKIMQDERAKAEERREARESGMNMMKELKSVINVRQRDSMRKDGSRIMSL